MDCGAMGSIIIKAQEVKMPIIDVVNLRKEFSVSSQRKGVVGAIRHLFSGTNKILTAVDGISFQIEEGEFVAYLGPNGAGKSTTIKMLTGILVATKGSATVMGLTPWKERKQNALNFGAVFGQRPQLWWDLSPANGFELLKKH